MNYVNSVDIEKNNLPLWSVPFGQVMLESIKYNPDIRNIFNMGSSTGFPLLELSQRLGIATQLYGIDIDINSIYVIQQEIIHSVIPNITITHGNAGILSFKNNYFDFIISNNGINNVENNEKTIAECSKDCNYGGRLIFTYNLDNTYFLFYNFFSDVLRKNELVDKIKRVFFHIFQKLLLDIFKPWVQKTEFAVIDMSYSHLVMCFSNVKSLFNRYFIQKYFLSEWLGIIRRKYRDSILKELKIELDNRNICGF